MIDWGLVGPLMAIISAVAAPVVAYRLAVRKMSGVVTTSAAEELWNESRSIRDDYRTRLVLAHERIDKLLARVELAEAAAEALRDENALLREQLTKLDRTVNGTP